MKKTFLFIAFAFLAIHTSAQKLNVEYKFSHLENGYDHDCRVVVYIDGVQVMTTKTRKESQGDSFEVILPEGKHRIRLVNEALYEGKWEEHTTANDYSQDCTYEFKAKLGKKSKIKLKIDFDLDHGTKVVVSAKKATIL